MATVRDCCADHWGVRLTSGRRRCRRLLQQHDTAREEENQSRLVSGALVCQFEKNNTDSQAPFPLFSSAIPGFEAFPSPRWSQIA